MRKTGKRDLPLMLFLLIFAAIVCGILHFYLTGQPEAVSAEQLSDVLSDNDLIPMNITDKASENFPGAGLLNCTVAEQDDIRFEFYAFDNQNSALKVYREAKKLIITEKMAAPRTEIETGKANYKYYSLAAGGNYSVAVYVDNTAIYAYCSEENQSKIIGILDMIEYVDTETKQDTPTWVLSVMRILQFALYIPMALVGRSFIWRAAYLSAGITRRQLNDLEMTRKDLLNWVLEVSPKKRRTKTILLFYKLYLLPIYACIALALVGCFTEKLDSTLNIVGIAIPLLIFVTGLFGAMLGKYFESNDI